MANEGPWKLAAIAMALVIVTVVATGLVVANRGDKKMVDVSPGPRDAERGKPIGGTGGTDDSGRPDANRRSTRATSPQRPRPASVRTPEIP